MRSGKVDNVKPLALWYSMNAHSECEGPGTGNTAMNKLVLGIVWNKMGDIVATCT